MKRVALAVLLLMSSLAVLAMPQQPTFNIMKTQMPQQERIEIMARSMQRDGVGTHAAGNVQVRITHADGNRTVIHADEVIYHADTGEIETRGDAKITVEKAK